MRDLGKEKEKDIIEIINPKDKEITVKTRSALISREPGRKNEMFKTAVIRLFEENNPHKKNIFPTSVYKFNNTEKVRMRNLTLSFYLEGSDLVINDLKSLKITREECKIVLFADQEDVEKRLPENMQ